MTPSLTVAARIERWPIAGGFTISRGAKTEAVVIVAEVSRQGPNGKAIIGRGECVPYARYNETPEGTLAAILGLQDALRGGLDRQALQSRMSPGAARNALDCALWDLEARVAEKRIWDLLGRPEPRPLTTAYTISLGTPQAMAEATAKAAHRPLLKIKLGGDGDEARIAAVRKAAPASELIVDANEAWTEADLERHLAACADAGVTMIEQPLPAGQDEALARIKRPVSVCADESVHDRASLGGLRERYDAINIKLDKTGGLTEALAMAEAARTLEFDLMVGCMVATSLAMAPAMMIAQGARVVDLDGPLLLARDRDNGLRYDGSTVYPPDAGLWG
ncbi:dipeptide epimerase [Afipia massiliensis]|uniref:Dipeptide epimerase n=1 Tax=Afipia massiliensis TaxID=211460 RepID=A0A4V6BE55_9BRAD|nr:N-acetyl-D-Glu racemase DgcA [Afipia massiliensis]TKT72433.1 dipeptide epimerase [Afipia massiliensis]